MNANIAIEFALAYQALEKAKAIRREAEERYADAQQRFRDAEDALKIESVSVRNK